MADAPLSPAPVFTPFLWPWQTPRQFRRRWRRYWIDDPLFGAMYYAIHHIGRVLPIDWCSGFGALLGLLSWHFFHDRDRMRTGLIYTALTGARPDEVAAAVRRVFINLGRIGTEYSTLDRLWAKGRIVVSGAEPLLAARREGRPVLLMGLHLSNWEVIGPTLVGLGLQGCEAFYQPRRSRFETRIIVGARERCGVKWHPPSVTTARRGRRLLEEQRGVLLVFADEERRGRVSAPTFGRPLPARANLLDIARLARGGGATIIPVYAVRQQGARFRVTFLPPIDLPEQSLAADTAMLDRTIEGPVLTHLEQWYMLVEETAAIAEGGYPALRRSAASLQGDG